MSMASEGQRKVWQSNNAASSKTYKKEKHYSVNVDPDKRGEMEDVGLPPKFKRPVKKSKNKIKSYDLSSLDSTFLLNDNTFPTSSAPMLKYKLLKAF